METLLYVLGFIIGALGTWFLLYFLKTRKLLRQQHELIMEFPIVLHALTEKLIELETGKKHEKPAKKKPCECDPKDSEPARQEPGNTAGPTE